MTSLEDTIFAACEKFKEEGTGPVEKMTTLGFDMKIGPDQKIAPWAVANAEGILLDHVGKALIRGEDPRNLEALGNLIAATLLTGITVGIMSEQERSEADDEGGAEQEKSDIEIGLMNEYILKAAGPESGVPDDDEEFKLWVGGMGIEWGAEDEGRNIYQWAHGRAKEDVAEMIAEAVEGNSGAMSLEDLIDGIAQSIVAATVIGVSAVFMCSRETM